MKNEAIGNENLKKLNWFAINCKKKMWSYLKLVSLGHAFPRLGIKTRLVHSHADTGDGHVLEGVRSGDIQHQLSEDERRFPEDGHIVRAIPVHLLSKIENFVFLALQPIQQFLPFRSRLCLNTVERGVGIGSCK